MCNWEIAEDFVPKPSIDPDFNLFPPKGKRLVRVQRELRRDYWEMWDVPIPIKTPKNRELEIALEELDLYG